MGSKEAYSTYIIELVPYKQLFVTYGGIILIVQAASSSFSKAASCSLLFW